MASYLGAFPFQKALAPTMLTFEAMVKVVVLVTNRFEKVLKKGKSDQVRLLFGSLADVARKPAASSEEVSNGNTEDSVPDDETRGAQEDGQETQSKTGSQGFSVDEPSNDEEVVEDDDDLALAALESLDAIDVFKLDQRIERTTYEAKVSEDTLRRLLALLLAIAPLRTHEDAKRYTTNLERESMAAIHSQIDAILAAFPREDPESKGFEYKAFYDVVRASLPYMLNPLTALFEQFLFSANLDLSKRRDSKIEGQFNELAVSDERPKSPITCPGAFESVILNDALMSQLS
ncbi:Restriction of telomere capping protein 5, partial [Ascosphaera atra]